MDRSGSGRQHAARPGKWRKATSGETTFSKDLNLVRHERRPIPAELAAPPGHSRRDGYGFDPKEKLSGGALADNAL